MQLLKLFSVLILFSCSTVKFSAEEEAFVERKVRMLLLQGNKYLTEDDSLLLAKASYQVARELKPNDARVLDALGAVAWREGKDQVALDFFKAAYAQDYRYDRPLVHLALVAEKRGDILAAKELLLKAIKMNPLNYRAKNNLGALIANYNLDSRNESISHFYQSYALAGKDDPVVNYNLRKEQE